MTRLQEQIETVLPLEPTFDFVADFANAERWDPGVFRSTRLDDGPLRQGSRFALDVRMGQRIAPMTYEVSALERPIASSWWAPDPAWTRSMRSSSSLRDQGRASAT